MGFSFNPFKAVTRAFGIPDKVGVPIQQALNIVFPVQFAANTLLNKGLSLATRSLAPPKNSNVTQNTIPYQLQPGLTPNITYGAPSYSAPYYGGGGGFDAYSLQPQTPYGGSPWGYSTTYSPPLIPQYQGSSGAQDRTWEDLTQVAGAVLPFFL